MMPKERQNITLSIHSSDFQIHNSIHLPNDPCRSNPAPIYMHIPCLTSPLNPSWLNFPSCPLTPVGYIGIT